jgi:hypothetical protein
MPIKPMLGLPRSPKKSRELISWSRWDKPSPLLGGMIARVDPLTINTR